MARCYAPPVVMECCCSCSFVLPVKVLHDQIGPCWHINCAHCKNPWVGGKSPTQEQRNNNV